MNLEGFSTGINFVQHDCVAFLLRHEDVKLQRPGLVCPAPLGMHRQVLQVLVALPSAVLIAATTPIWT